MELAFSSNAFKRVSLDDAIEEIASIGYRGVELMADMHHAFPPLMTEARVRELRKRLGNLGVSVSNMNAFTGFACGMGGGMGDTYHPTWIEADARLRQVRVEHTKRAMEVAAAFKCRTVSVQPGGPMIGRGLSAEDAGEMFAAGVSECVEFGRGLGVVVAVEPEPGLLIQTSGEYLAWKGRYFSGEPGVKMNCDIGHLFCVGEDPAKVIQACSGEVAHVHMEDIGKNRVHQHLTPGRGIIDFAAVFRALGEVAYGGRVTVELYPYESSAGGVAQAAFDYLGSVLGEKGGG